MAPQPPDHQPDARDPDESSSTALTAAQRARLQRCFERGQRLMQQKQPDHEYAHTMFVECVLHDPASVVYADALLDNLRRKYGENRRGRRFQWPFRRRLKKAQAAGEWDALFRLGLERLKANPWDVAALRAMAQACGAKGHFEAELRYLRAALDADPKDVDLNRHCGRTLARLGQFDHAVACWRRVLDTVHGDEEALRMISEMTLAKTMGIPPGSPVGTQPTGTRRAPAPAGTELAASSRAAGTAAVSGSSQLESGAQAETSDRADATELAEPDEPDPLEQLQAAVAEQPGDVERALELAEAYRRQHQYSQAERVLQRCLEAGGTSLAILDRLDEVRLDGARARLEIAERRSAAQPSVPAVRLVGELRGDLQRLEMEIYYQRCERYPRDRHLRLRLGQTLKRAGNFSQAIRYLQEAADEAELAAVAHLEIGECFQHLRQFTRALQAYQASIASNGSSPDDQETTKLGLYRAGLLAAAMGQWDQARQWLGRLHDQDARYRDVRSHLDRLREIGNKE